MQPKNGYYLTQEDFPNFQDEFSKTWRKLHPEVSENCGDEQLCKNVTFCVTERCNLACTYCYEIHKTGRRMSFDTAKRIVDSLFEGQIVDSKSPAIILEFIGGEPLLEIDLIDKTVDYFKRKAYELHHPWAYYYMISISTNGVLFDTPKVQEFIRKNYRHLSLGISIDGDKKLHDSCRVFPDGKGSYDIVAKSAQKLLKMNPATSTKVTLAPENLPYLVDAIKHLYKMGYHFIPANCVFENVWKETDAEVFYGKLVELADWMLDNEIYKEMCTTLFAEHLAEKPSDVRREETKTTAYCGGNGRMTAYDPTGKAYPCLRYMKHSLKNQPERPIGDVDTGLYKDAPTVKWYDDLCKVTTYSSADEECRRCPGLAYCTTCIAWQYDATGNPNCKTKYHCKMFKAQAAANYYYWKKLYAKLKINKKVERIFPKLPFEREV